MATTGFAFSVLKNDEAYKSMLHGIIQYFLEKEREDIGGILLSSLLF